MLTLLTTPPSPPGAPLMPAGKYPCPIIIIDGTLQQVENWRVEYFNGRKAKYCLNHIAVCDWRGVWRKIFSGYPGHTHDATAFQTTPLFKQMRDVTQLGPEGRTMLGDAGFQGCSIIPPPKHKKRAADGQAIPLTPEEKVLWHKITRHRVMIEFSFGYLKHKWGILQCKWRWGRENAPLMFELCCMLSNFLYRKHGYLRDHAYHINKAYEAWEVELAAVLGNEEWNFHRAQVLMKAERVYRLTKAAAATCVDSCRFNNTL